MDKLFLNKNKKLIKTASTCCVLSILADQSFKDNLNSFIFSLMNVNVDLEFQPQENPHIVVVETDSELDYPSKMELTSFLRRLIPRKSESLNLKTAGVGFGGKDNLDLVLKLNSKGLLEINQKLKEFLIERGFSLDKGDFDPHIVLGKVNKNVIYIPPVPRIDLKVSDLRLRLRD